MELNKIIAKVLLSLVILLWASLSFAQSPLINNGLSHLQSTQSPEGYWGDAAEVSYNSFVDTCAVAETLKYLNETGTPYNSAIQWINTTGVFNNDYLFTKILVLSQAGFDISVIRDYLLSIKNEDGGWGVTEGIESDIKRTSLALQAVKAANYSDPAVIQAIISYLLSTQNYDGGFGFYQGDDSNVYMTALVSSTLQQFSQTASLATSLATAINKATSYLIAHQNADGGFGPSTGSGSTVYETALAYIALVSVITDNTVLGNAVNYLTSTQSQDGSWNQDPYSTALALRALYLSENKPSVPPQPPTEITPPVIEPSPSDTTITGKVTDASTGQPIPNAEVAITGTTFSAKTDATGFYTITGITQLEFTLKASAAGYDSKTSNVKTIAYGTYTINISLNQSQVTDIKITSLTTDRQTYPAGSPVTITATLMNSGNAASEVVVSAKIINQQGTILYVIPYSQSPITVNPQGSADISLGWNTVQQSPGIYKIILTATSSAQGILLDQKEILFSVEPTFALTNAILSISPTFTYNGKTETIKLSTSFSYESNISADVQAAYMLKDSQNNTLEQGIILISLPAGNETIYTETVYKEIAQITRTFTTGQYSFSVIFSRDGIVLKEVTASFSVLSNIRINTQRNVTPTTVVPDANGKVKITIELKGVEQ